MVLDSMNNIFGCLSLLRNLIFCLFNYLKGKKDVSFETLFAKEEWLVSLSQPNYLPLKKGVIMPITNGIN